MRDNKDKKSPLGQEGNAYLAELDKCGRCGNCLPNCPVFAELQRESSVIRGRVEILDRLRKGEVEWNEKLAEIFSTCMLCGNCTKACNSGVRGGLLTRMARRDIRKFLGPQKPKDNALFRILCETGKEPAFCSPDELAAVGSNLPNLAKEEFLRKLSSKLPKSPIKPKMTIAYFPGCMTYLVNPQIGYDILEILAAYDVKVIIPEQKCCGKQAMMEGDFDTAKEVAAKNITSFAKEEFDYLLFECGSCLTTWQEYQELLPDAGAQSLIAKGMHISRFLTEVLDIHFDYPATIAPGKKVTYHDACHLKETTSGKSAPRELLKRMAPYYQYAEMALADSCCGSIGYFGDFHFDLSQKILQKKIDSILETKADIVTADSSCCLINLIYGLREHPEVEVKHIVELVAEALRQSL